MADARLGAQSNEVVTNGLPDRRLAAIGADVLTTQETTPSRQLGAVSNDVLSTAAAVPQRQLGAISVEVLVPARFGFVGWGIPVRTSTWS